MKKLKHIAIGKWVLLPGMLLCALIAVPAWFLGKAFPVIGGPVLAILAGILLSALVPKICPERAFAKIRLRSGINFTGKKLLQYAIVLLGFEMNLFTVIGVGRQSFFLMLFTIAAAFAVAFIVGKALKLPGDTTTLVGVGTAICGGSAIAATAPIIRAKDADVARAISTIFLFNIAAVFLFPVLGHFMGMNDTSFGMWAGTAINDTSSVVAAGTSWSNAAGSNTALQFATIVKLTRTLMIVPITLVLAVYTAHRQKKAGTATYRFAKVFPWFVLLFILAAVVNTFTGMPQAAAKGLGEAGKFMIVMAMGAIGLNTNLKSLVSNGLKPILLGLCCWVAVAAVSIAVQRALGI